MNSKKMAYRPDIDGLRAIAVMAVVLFHANFSWFEGGFVGVDMFFVISGYLITCVILKNNEPLRSFLARFYESRVRRLLPPAVPVLICTSLAAYLILSAEAMDEYTKSLLSFFAFVSNWFFWDIAGYFDGPSHLKPLLHTWSLSVEEQFYLFFPALAILLLRNGRRYLLLVVLAIVAASFALNIYFVVSADLNSAFFNSIGRFWEMGIGATLACGIVRPPETKAARNIASGIGLTAILGSIALMKPELAFPGAWALIPTLGTALVIYANGGRVAQWLSRKPIVGVGLISYALYLWHWPIFAFLNIHFGAPTPLHFMAAIAASLALAVLSYFLIEQPIRTRAALPARHQAFAGMGIVLAAFSLFGVAGIATGGFPGRLPEAAVDYAQHRSAQLKIQRKAALLGTCWVNGDVPIETVLATCLTDDGRPRVLLVGDSHIAQLYTPIKDMLPGYNVNLLAVNSCSLAETVTDKQRISCLGLIKFLDNLGPDDFRAVIMTTRANLFAENLAAYTKRAERLAQFGSVIILGPIQFYKPNMPDIFGGANVLTDKPAMTQMLNNAVQAAQFDADSRYRSAFLHTSARYLSLIDVTCPQGKCQHLDSKGFPILIDNSHLSLEAATSIAEKLLPQLGL